MIVMPRFMRGLLGPHEKNVYAILFSKACMVGALTPEYPEKI
jgi:hypothetical protein